MTKKIFKDLLGEYLNKINKTIIDEKEKGIFKAYKNQFDNLKCHVLLVRTKKSGA